MNATRTSWLALGCLWAATAIAFGAERTLRVGVYPNSPKVGWSETGKPEGIFVDLVEAIAAEEDWQLEYVPGTWSEGLDRLAAAEIDLMPDVALDEERRLRFAFHSEPVLSSWFQIYARRGGGIRSILDLNGQRIALLEGSIQQSAFDKLVKDFDLATPLLPFADYDDAFAAVIAGQADAVVANRFYGTAHLRDAPIEDTGILFHPTRLFFAAPRTGDPAILDAIDRHLKRMKQDHGSAYYRSFARWTAEDVRFQLPAWIKIAAAAAATGLLLTLAWSFALKRRVAARTRELAQQSDENLRMDRRARASEERLRLHAQLLDSVRESVTATDLEGRILYWSRGAEILYGYSADEVMGKPYRDFAGSTEPPDEAAFRKELVEKGTWQDEHVQKNRNGETFWTSTVVSLVVDERGQPAGFIGIDRDITERKRAEAEQRESQARFAALFDANPAGLMLVDRKTRSIAQVNATAIGMIGLPAEAIVGRICHGFMCPAETCSCPVCDLGQTVDRSERTLIRADGRLMPILKTVVPVALEGRDYLLEIFIDLSERKKAQEERERLQAQLHQAQKLESVGRLAGGIAHDFNNVIGAILGIADLMLHDIEPAHPHYEDLAEIKKSAERATDLTRQLLAFARQQPIQPVELDLNPTVAGLLKMIRRLFGENVEVAWRPSPEPEPVRMDPSQIDQILVNLCVNARDAMGGHGRIAIETDHVHYPESGSTLPSEGVPGDYVRLSVSDTGCGMDEETRAKLFEPFFTTKEAGKGTGLGLATVYGIVQQNQGFIDVESEPGRGSVFRIYLPRRPNRPEKTDP